MKEKDLLSFLGDIVEQDSDLETLKSRHTIHNYGKCSLNMLKRIIIYGLEHHILEVSKYVRSEKRYINLELMESKKIIENDNYWENGENEVYYVTFIDIPHYFFIIFGPYGVTGEHAFEGAKVPDEFTQFIIE